MDTWPFRATGGTMTDAREPKPERRTPITDGIWRSGGGRESLAIWRRLRRGALLILPWLFSQAAWGAPAATIEVLPRFASTRDQLAVTVHGNPELCWPAAFVWNPPRLVGQKILLEARPAPGPLPPSCGFPGPHHVLLAPLPVGLYSAEFRFAGELRGAEAFTVLAPTSLLDLQRGRFAVAAAWTDPASGVEHEAEAVQLTDESGYFWFFSAGNIELTVKVLDGRGLNGAFWVFIASLTDVEYTVRVTDTTIVCILPGCNEKVYQGPAGRNQNFIDVEAFQF
jgi:hypothetical protein